MCAQGPLRSIQFLPFAPLHIVERALPTQCQPAVVVGPVRSQPQLPGCPQVSPEGGQGLGDLHSPQHRDSSYGRVVNSKEESMAPRFPLYNRLFLWARNSLPRKRRLTKCSRLLTCAMCSNNSPSLRINLQE